ncbi:MAG: ImmA/IrrE family metallo-endopeptidase [Solirubrobacterales bacterium]|nr:ImmA/IrrE family metallo-endopeptidase [Solirubrobacterales bacterium]
MTDVTSIGAASLIGTELGNLDQGRQAPRRDPGDGPDRGRRDLSAPGTDRSDHQDGRDSSRVPRRPGALRAGNWTEQGWLIELSTEDSPSRQRMTLFHEFKHLIDDPLAEDLYPTSPKPAGELERQRRIERICDYFAAQALMPKLWLKHDVRNGLRDSRALARRYGVSYSAMKTQLEELGLGSQTREAGR